MAVERLPFLYMLSCHHTLITPHFPSRSVRHVSGALRWQSVSESLIGVQKITNQPLSAKDQPLSARVRPLKGWDRPLRGRDRPLRGGDQVLKGRDWPQRGRDLEFSTSIWLIWQDF